MIKQCTAAALMVASALTSLWAVAAREEHEFEVSVTVPTRSFYILPADPDWIYREQILPWNVATSRLGNLRKYFDVRHDTSAIDARLSSVAYLSNGRSADDIALRVTFNGVELSHAEPRQVVSAADAAAGSRVLLEIEPQQPPGGYRAGDYYGNVLLLFNARAPGS